MTGASVDRGATDPFAVLGLERTASLDQLRAARRRLAFELHPDRHPGTSGDATRMQQVNEAFDRCVGHVTGRRPIVFADTAGSPGPVGTAARAEPASRPRPPRGRHPRFRGVEHDTPSFTIDALPAEAFEALLIVATWIGEVVDDDPPYVLECMLTEPGPCWCRLDLVPDAGGSTVSLAVAAVEVLHGGDGSGVDDERVSAESVRDVWVDHLNRLGQQPP